MTVMYKYIHSSDFKKDEIDGVTVNNYDKSAEVDLCMF